MRLVVQCRQIVAYAAITAWDGIFIFFFDRIQLDFSYFGLENLPFSSSYAWIGHRSGSQVALGSVSFHNL